MVREYQPRNYRRGICKACRLIAYIYMEARCWECYQAVVRERKKLWHRKNAVAVSLRRAKRRKCRQCGQKRQLNRQRVCTFCQKNPVPVLNASPNWAIDADQEAYFEAPYPETPTTCMPGSPGKVEVMIARAERREKLFHPKDARDPELPHFALGRGKATGPRRLGGVRS